MASAKTVAVVVPSPAASLVLLGHFAHHLGAHVFKWVFELDFLGDAHTVFGDGGGTKLLVENHVAALGTEGGLDGTSEDFHTAQK